MTQLESSPTIVCSPNPVDRSVHDKAIAPFLQPGEKYCGNYGLIQSPDSPVSPLEVHIQQLYKSGKYLSVRTSEEACFDMHGIHFTGSVAIIVTLKPEEVQR